MTRSSLAILSALTATVVGMILVIAGVVITGLFMPGVVLIAIGLIGFAAAAVLHTRSAEAGVRAAKSGPLA